MNNEIKATPGPWSVRDIATPCVYIGPAADPGAPSVALVMARVNVPDGQQKANARLIAAAPQLLEALKEADRLYSTYGLLANDASAGPWINAVRDAIRAAGGQP